MQENRCRRVDARLNFLHVSPPVFLSTFQMSTGAGKFIGTWKQD